MRIEMLIDAAALAHNLQRVKQYAPNSRIMAVIKANAYGHGIANVVPVLEGVDYFGVTTLEEAFTARQHTQKPVVLMMGFNDAEELREIATHGFHCFIHDARHLHLLDKITPPQSITVWPKFNTGMNRLGFDMTEYHTVHQTLNQLSHVQVYADVTQLACASEADCAHAIEQITLFDQYADAHRQSSIANSAAIIQYPQTHRDIVRPGMMLYGAEPIANTTAQDLDLQPVMTLKAKIISTYTIATGETAGYQATWQAKRPTRIANVAIGYADGYPQSADGAYALIHHQRVPVIGRVSMGCLNIDITDVPQASCDDMATLWGKALPIGEIATATGRSCYELLVNAKVRR